MTRAFCLIIKAISKKLPIYKQSKVVAFSAVKLDLSQVLNPFSCGLFQPAKELKIPEPLQSGLI